jgi:hypothetical protein
VARRRRPVRAPFEEMPEHLQSLEDDSVRPQLDRWLEANGWGFVDFVGWLRDVHAQRLGIVRPPARRTGALPDEVLRIVEAAEYGLEE